MYSCRPNKSCASNGGRRGIGALCIERPTFSYPRSCGESEQSPRSNLCIRKLVIFSETYARRSNPHAAEAVRMHSSLLLKILCPEWGTEGHRSVMHHALVIVRFLFPLHRCVAIYPCKVQSILIFMRKDFIHSKTTIKPTNEIFS